MIFEIRSIIFLAIIFLLIAIYGAVCFVKFILSKNKSFKNIKEPLVIYASWSILWLWTFNNSFYLTYSYLAKYGAMHDNLDEVFKYIMNAVSVSTVFIIIMFLVVILLGKKIKKHILIGCSVYFYSWLLPDYASSLAVIVASWKWMPQGVVSFLHQGYNVLFWCYVIGFLVYGIVMKIIHIREKKLLKKQ